VSFQLVALITGLESVPQPYSRSTNNFPYTQAAFRITQDGNPVHGWIPSSVRIRPKDGKQIRPRMTHHGSHDAELIYNFSELLDPAAGPWKLEVEFTQQSGFAEDQLVKFRTFPFR